MYYYTHDLTVPGEGEAGAFKIYGLGDTHIGNRNTDIGKIKEDVAEIKHDKLARVIGLGDYIDFLSYKDKRFDPRQLAELKRPSETAGEAWRRHLSDMARAQSDYFIELVEPIKDRFLVMLTGNHDMVTLGNVNATEYTCQQLKVPYGDYCAGVNIRVKLARDKRGYAAYTMKILAHHGSAGGGEDGAKLTKLQKWAANFDGLDLVFVGHFHTKVNGGRVLLGWTDEQFPHQTDRYVGFIINGTYQKTYNDGPTDWHGRSMMKPSLLGASHARCWFKRDYVSKHHGICKRDTRLHMEEVMRAR